MIKPFPKSSSRRSEVRRMTVCLAALCEEGKAIVCIADKALSYGEYIQWDSDSSKLIEINPTGAIVLFSGGEEASSRVLGRLLAREGEIGLNVKDTTKLCEEEYKLAVDELIEAKFLRPRLLSRKEYIAAITGPAVNPYITSIAKEIDKFEMECSLLVCGHNSDTRLPFILLVVSPGIVTDMTNTGFHAIGSGWEKAVSKLLFSEFKRTHSVQRILYDSFDAKATAEMAVGVGYEWDAGVVAAFGDEKITSVSIDKPTKDLIERAWAKHNRSPFEKRQKDDLPNPPKDWREKLVTYVVLKIIGKERNAPPEK